MNPFLDKARSEGYSDDEIADYMSSSDESKKSFIDTARNEGYSSSEILNHFSGTPEEKESSHPLIQAGKMAANAASTALRPVGQYLLGSVEASPFVFGPEIAGRAASSLHGSETMQAAGFRQNAVEEIEQLLQKKYYSPSHWTDKDETRLQQFQELAEKSPEQLKKEGAFFEPAKIAPSSIIEKIPGQEPKGLLEHAARLTGLLVNAGYTGAEKVAEELSSKLGKFLSPRLLKETEEVIRSAPLATTAIAANEIFGIPDWVTLGIGGLTSATYKAGKNAASWLGKKFALFDPANLNPYNLKKSYQAEVQNARKYAQEQLQDGLISAEQYEATKGYFDVAEKYGIPLTYGSITDSVFYKTVEDQILKSNLTAPQVQALRQQAQQAWGESMSTAMKDMQRTLIYSEPGAVAEALMTDVTRKHHADLQKEWTDLYTKSSKELANSKNISPESYREIENALNEVIEIAEGSFIPTTAETGVQSLAKTAKKNLTISPKEANLPEFGYIGFPTGKGEAAQEIAQTGEKLQEAVTSRVSKRKSAEEAKEKFIQKRRKKGKRQAKRELQQASEEALRAGQFVEHEAGRARESVLTAQEKQSQRMFESQEDLVDAFGPQAEYMRLDPNGRMVFTKPINGKNINDTVRSLNKIIDWENPQVLNYMSGPRKTLKKVLEKEYGKSHPEAIKNHQKANEKFAEGQELFGKNSKWKKWGLDQDVLPEDLLRTINSVDRLKAFEKDFPQSKDLIDHFKHLKIEEMLNPIFRQRNYDPGAIANGIHNLERDPMFNYMVSKDTITNLKGLQSLDAHLERTASKFFSNTQPSIQQTGFWTDIKSLLNIPLQATKLGNSISKNQMASVYADILLNPNFTKEMHEIGKEAVAAAKSGNPQKIAAAQSRMDLLWTELGTLGQMTGASSLIK